MDVSRNPIFEEKGKKTKGKKGEKRKKKYRRRERGAGSSAQYNCWWWCSWIRSAWPLSAETNAWKLGQGVHIDKRENVQILFLVTSEYGYNKFRTSLQDFTKSGKKKQHTLIKNTIRNTTNVRTFKPKLHWQLQPNDQGCTPPSVHNQQAVEFLSLTAIFLI